MPNKTVSYIALGSNLSDPEMQLQHALEALKRLPQTELNMVSSLYQSKPLGPQDQPEYINAVAKITTAMTPIELLDALQNIENNQGRVRTRRWGERTLDLDILLYGNEVIQSERLTVPHYDMQNREFVLIPLLDIAPDLIMPDGTALAYLAEKFKTHSMQRMK